MAVRKLKEELNFDRCFTDVCKVYVNGKELDISGLDTYDQVGDVFVAECRRTPELEGWIREYMNSLGDPVVDDTDSVEEVCRLFAKELDMDLHDSEPGEFYVDGSGSVFDNKNVRVEIFEENVKRGRNNMTVKRVNESGRLVNGRHRELSPQYSVSESKTSKRRSKRVNEDFDDDPSWADVAENPFMDYDGLDEFGEMLSKAASIADDLNYWLSNASKAFNNNSSAAIEAFSGPDATRDATDYILKIVRALKQAYSWIPNEVRDLADIGYEERNYD